MPGARPTPRSARARSASTRPSSTGSACRRRASSRCRPIPWWLPTPSAFTPAAPAPAARCGSKSGLTAGAARSCRGPRSTRGAASPWHGAAGSATSPPAPASSRTRGARAAASPPSIPPEPQRTPPNMPWDPAQYLKFAGPRLRPAIDLIARIEAAAPRLVYDLGAGAGNVTRLLAERWPQAEIVGVDGSPEMLARAAAELPHLAWEQADLAAWRPHRAPDLIYSNAALHWIEGHRELIVALFAALAPGGTLAIQMPRNFAAPSHRSMGEAARMGPWRSVLKPLLRPAPVSEPEVYYDLLAGRARRLDIWESE